MKNKMYHTSINLSIEAGVYQRLRMVAKLKKTSMSKLVRAGIRLKLEEIDKENNPSIGGQ